MWRERPVALVVLAFSVLAANPEYRGAWASKPDFLVLLLVDQVDQVVPPMAWPQMIPGVPGAVA
jgi:hypothetical protein